MKKAIITIAAAVLSLLAVSCDTNDKEDTTKGPSLVGEWSICDEPGKMETVRIHVSFKADGSFEMVMPAWIERRTGTYTDNGTSFTYKINKIEWVVNRNNGYANIYDQYGCWYVNDDFELSPDEREKYKDPQSQWENTNPQDASATIAYSFDADGSLILEGDGMLGMPMPYVKDTDFNANEAVKFHIVND